MTNRIQILNIDWQIKHLGNQAILLETTTVELAIIHRITDLIQAVQWQGVVEVVPAYASIAVFYDVSIINAPQIIQRLNNYDFSTSNQTRPTAIHRIPVCFEKGLDWSEVEKWANLDRQSFIEEFTTPTYTVAMLGFIPGFMYLDGLATHLHCPRKENPRPLVPVGSIGIGGSQTGIYALESPGGWQIIGQTSMPLFDKNKLPPTPIRPMDKVAFFSIDH
jgi:inhibitor of KinA